MPCGETYVAPALDPRTGPGVSPTWAVGMPIHAVGNTAGIMENPSAARNHRWRADIHRRLVLCQQRESHPGLRVVLGGVAPDDPPPVEQLEAHRRRPVG